MGISTGLVAKIIGGASVSTILAGGGIWMHKEGYFYSSSLTHWDQYIIDAIGNNGDTTSINFTMDGSGNDFPSFSGSPSKASISFKITASTQTIGSSKATLKSKNKIKFYDMENETDWTWKCTIEFVKQSEATKNMSEEDKKIVYKSNSEGVIWKITQTNNAELKKKIIKLCASARDPKTNRKLNGLSNLDNELSKKISTGPSTEYIIESTKKFELKDGAQNLEFLDRSSFESWFK